MSHLFACLDTTAAWVTRVASHDVTASASVAPVVIV